MQWCYNDNENGTKTADKKCTSHPTSDCTVAILNPEYHSSEVCDKIKD